MKTIQKKDVRNTFVFSALAVMLAFAAPAGAALQGSAGNTIIRNTVTVNYNDAVGTPQTPVTARVDITVTTVNVAPTVKAVTPSPGSTGSTGATQVYAVEVVTNSNGPGSINLSAADGSPTNITLSGTGPSFTPSSVFLGSSLIDPTDARIGVAQNVAGAASITFNIPNDGGVPTDGAASGGAIGDNSVNALSVNDTVYLYDGTTYYGKFTVTAVADNAVGAGTTAAASSITLRNDSGAPVAFTPAYGWMIVESKTVNMTVTQGTATGTPATWTTTITGNMGGQTGTNTVVTNVNRLTVAKYSRNVTVPVVGATPLAPAINGGGVTFYQTGVTGKPKDIMEYLYVITNSGAGIVRAVVATDTIPTYTTLRSSSAAYGANNTGGATGTIAVARRTVSATDQAIKADNSSGNNTIAWGKSTGTNAGSVMTYYLGNNSTNATGGDLAAGETAYVIYRVTID